MPNVVQLRRGPWTKGEAAELNAITVAALSSGLRVLPCGGTSDEGDPWYALVNPCSDATILHVCRDVTGYVAFGDNVLRTYYRSLSEIAPKIFAGAFRGLVNNVAAVFTAGLIGAGCFPRLMYALSIFTA
jgi:hypothetical protein